MEHFFPCMRLRGCGHSCFLWRRRVATSHLALVKRAEMRETCLGEGEGERNETGRIQTGAEMKTLKGKVTKKHKCEPKSKPSGLSRIFSENFRIIAECQRKERSLGMRSMALSVRVERLSN